MNASYPYRACIFDLDGTLADTLQSIAYFGNGTLRAFGLPPIPPEEYKLLVGNGAERLMQRMLLRVNAELSAPELVRFRAEYDRRYEEEPSKLAVPYPGLPQLLSRLKAEGILLAVLSNKPDNMTQAVVSLLYPGVMNAVRGQREGVPEKPDPTAVLALLEELGVRPDNALYVGDSGVDMETARRAGLTSCGVLWGFRSREELLEHGAVYLAKNADDLAKILGVAIPSTRSAFSPPAE